MKEAARKMDAKIGDDNGRRVNWRDAVGCARFSSPVMSMQGRRRLMR